MARSFRKMFDANPETGVAEIDMRLPMLLEEMISLSAETAGMNRQLPRMIRGR